MRFEGSDNEINVKTSKPEFFEWKWINIEDLTKVVVHFKLNVYKKLQGEINKFLSLN